MSAKTRMTPSEAFVETLLAQGVRDVFGIVGSAYMDALDLFPLAGIRFIPGGNFACAPGAFVTAEVVFVFAVAAFVSIFDLLVASTRTIGVSIRLRATASRCKTSRAI